MQQISLAITTYQRVELTLKSFDLVLNDERINEIVIVDDHSDIEIYNQLESVLKYYPKVKLYRNEVNLDCYKNKAKALSLATNDYCILLDSDNQIDTSYIDKIYENEWSEDTALMPHWAMPLFNYTEFSGLIVTKGNVAQFMNRPFFSTMLNCANYFVNKNFYLQCFDENINPVTADSIFINYQWLLRGGKIKVVDGMTYQHLVHDGSHYKNNVHLTPSGLYEKIEKDLFELK